MDFVQLVDGRKLPIRPDNTGRGYMVELDGIWFWSEDKEKLPGYVAHYAPVLQPKSTEFIPPRTAVDVLRSKKSTLKERQAAKDGTIERPPHTLSYLAKDISRRLNKKFEDVTEEEIRKNTPSLAIQSLLIQELATCLTLD